VIVKLYIPAVSGVPVIWPELESVSPLGRDPAVTEKV
jgi:hypothetical protein